MAIARRSIGALRNPESEQAILRAARELIAEEGLAGFSIEAVARRARAGKPTIYRWWPSRTLLLLDVYAGLKQDLAKLATGSLESDVADFLLGLMGFWRDTVAGDVFRSVLAEAQSDPEARNAVAAYHLERLAETTAMLARPRQGEAPLTTEQARRLADASVAYAFNKLLMGRLDVPEREVRAVARMLAAGARAAR
jgi:AcrR family transcriptional regulator